MEVEYQILACRLHLTWQQMDDHMRKKIHFLLLAIIIIELLTLMPAILAYSASFPPRRLPHDWQLMMPERLLKQYGLFYPGSLAGLHWLLNWLIIWIGWIVTDTVHTRPICGEAYNVIILLHRRLIGDDSELAHKVRVSISIRISWYNWIYHCKLNVIYQKW